MNDNVAYIYWLGKMLLHDGFTYVIYRRSQVVPASHKWHLKKSVVEVNKMQMNGFCGETGQQKETRKKHRTSNNLNRHITVTK